MPLDPGDGRASFAMLQRSFTTGDHARRRCGGRCIVVVLIAALIHPVAASGQDIEYVTRIDGVPDPAITATFREVSSLVTLQRDGPVNEIALERRAASDIKRLREILHSGAYYDAVVSYRIDASRTPVEVHVSVDAGGQYLVSGIDVALVATQGEEEAAFADELARLRRIEGSAAVARRILDTEAALVEGLVARGYPFAAITARRYVVDHAERGMRVEITLDVGPPAVFGAIRYAGLENVDEGYVRNRLPWREGEPYDPALVERARRQMAGTGLFSSVRVDHGSEVDADGSLPMTVEVKEGAFRTVSFGARYDSMLGVGGGVSWEHRNVRGGAERLRLTGDVAESGWSSGLTWREPDFIRPDYTLTYSAGYSVESTTAYDLKRAATSVGLGIPINDRWLTTIGTSLEWTPIETKARESDTGEREQDETFLLLGFPFYLVRSTAGSLLEPRDGTRVELALTPYTEISGKDLVFVVARVTPSAYVSFDLPGLPPSVLAGRVSVGAIEGEKRDKIPANKRFYAGGGGSIRGYEYQRVGPLDDDDEPLGGRSLLELGTELRLRITESFGIVGFFEGGNVYPSLYPDLDDVIRWGTGGGLRYYSPVGPIRVDIGTPVNPRDGIDDAVQFYISLGEAF
jgi:translocation and assembly module TamA